MCVLRTGETVIGDVKEVIDHLENKSLGYKVSNPYVVTYQYSNELEVTGEEVVDTQENNSKFYFKFWAPLSAERDFNFPYEFVDVIYEPHKDIVDSYLVVLEHYQKEFYQEFQVEADETVVTLPPDNDLTRQFAQQ